MQTLLCCTQGERVKAMHSTSYRSCRSSCCCAAMTFSAKPATLMCVFRRCL